MSSSNEGLRPTDEQAQICEAVAEATSHVMIDALAGTGKTSTLVMAAERVKGFGLALAFNKKIAEELTRRLPSSFECKTMNSLGFAALRGAKPGVTNWKIDDRKISGILVEQAKAAKRRLSGAKWSGAMATVRAAQLAGLRPGSPEGLVNDHPEVWRDLAEQAFVDAEDIEEVCALARSALIENNILVERGIASFDDQLYWPVVYGARFQQRGVIFGDEAQDWNALQHELVGRSLNFHGRLVITGDPRQSIYAWRGAVQDSMASLREDHTAKPWSELGLTMTWRCPRAIVERQLRHVPRYRAGPGAPEGRIARLGGWDEAGSAVSWSFEDLLALRPTPDSTIAILCRNNAPLWKLAFRLIRQRVSIVMQGADLGKQLTTLSRKIEPSEQSSTTTFLSKLRDWEASQLAKAKENETRAEGILDRAECLRAVAEYVRTAGELRSAIEELFRRTTGTIVLSTIHRAKGLEWDVVCHLDPWRVPSKRARAEGGEALAQEWNLKYVAETRTKEVLVLADLEAGLRPPANGRIE